MTINGGTTWEEVTTKFIDDFQCVWFANESTGWMAGDYGAIIKTTDGGATWTDQSITSTHPYFEACSFLSATTGFLSADDGEIWKTTDGGDNWTKFVIGKNYINAIWAFDTNNLVAGNSSGRLYRTADGGENVTDFTTDIIPANIMLYDIICFDENSLVMGGSNEGSIFRSSDGGNTWNSVPKVIYRTILDIVRLDGTTALACSEVGLIIKTTDKGANWTKKTSGSNSYLYALSCPDGNTVYACGQSGTILKSSDGGENWTKQTSGTTNTLYGISFWDANNGIAVGYSGTILRTTDGGAVWTTVTSSAYRTLYSVIHLNADTTILTGNSSMYFSSNGGANWTEKKMTEGLGILNKLVETASDTIYAFGALGRINYSADRGITWKKAESFTGNEIRGATETPSGILFVTGSNSTIAAKGKKHSTGTVSISDEDNNELLIYPNPGKNKIIIRNTDDELFIISDINGKTLLSGRHNPTGIDISALPDGMYILSLPANGNSGKFFIKK